MDQSFVRILGSADWHQTKHNDHSCYTVSDKILIDACPGVVTHLLDHDVDPINIPFVCFTHMHADHYMGLAPLLHYWRVCKDKDKDLSGLNIIGPKASVREAVQRALLFVFHDDAVISSCIKKMPTVIELEGDCEIQVPGFTIRAMDADHAVPGLCYRIQDTQTGHCIGFTGDTRYQKAFTQFFSGVDMLLHEASFGAGPVDEVANRSCRHSSAQEAVRICKDAKVGHLLLTHAYEPKREGALLQAHRQLTIPVDWAIPYQIYPF